jgi:hypothetical protein
VDAPDLPGSDDGGLAQVGHVVMEVPMEVVALQLLTQRYAPAHITVRSYIFLLGGKRGGKQIFT